MTFTTPSTFGLALYAFQDRNKKHAGAFAKTVKMSHMASTSAVTLEKYEQQRKEVRERHSQSLGTTTVSGEKSKKGSSGGLRSSSSIRGSELWRKYCSDSLRHTESTQGTHEAAELAPSAHPQPKLGPNYVSRMLEVDRPVLTQLGSSSLRPSDSRRRDGQK